MTKIHFRLPDCEITERDFARFHRSFADNFGEYRVHYTAPDAWGQRHSATHGIQIDTAAPTDVDHLVGIFDRKRPKKKRNGLAGVPARPNQRRWRFNLTNTYMRARLEPEEMEPYGDLYPPVDTHAFNRLGSRTTDQFIYFPYGYMFRMLGAGPLDAFGHRIAEPLEGLADRPDTYKVILYFGGSSAWSLDCLYSEMLTHQLELRLNEHAARAGTGRSYRVVNMGQHGNVVLNEMLTYLLRGERLRPDIVIAHDGFNDLTYGVSNDELSARPPPHCLSGHSGAMAGRSPRVIRGKLDLFPQTASTRSGTRPRRRYGLTSNASASSSVSCVSSGAAFSVWGLQPCLASKAARHPLEDEYLELDKPFRSQSGLAYSNAKRLLDDVSASLERDPPEHVVNHRRAFAEADADRLSSPTMSTAHRKARSAWRTRTSISSWKGGSFGAFLGGPGGPCGPV